MNGMIIITATLPSLDGFKKYFLMSKYSTAIHSDVVVDKKLGLLTNLQDISEFGVFVKTSTVYLRINSISFSP